MIIIGEKLNGAIPSMAKTISSKDEENIRRVAQAQAAAGADFIDCAPSTGTEIEYETMLWMLKLIQESTEVPVSLDSPNAHLLARILEEGHVLRPGMINSVNEEGDKCETIFPLIAGTDWQVIALTCDKGGIPMDIEKKVDIARAIIEKADKYGVALKNVHIDPCVMSLPTCAAAMTDFETCIHKIKEYAPEVKITGAISNISFDMPARKLVNMAALTLAVRAGLDSAIMDPCNRDMLGTIFAAEALCAKDKNGRKYNRAYRAGKFGVKK